MVCHSTLWIDQSGYERGKKNLLKRFDRKELIKGCCSEVRAMLKEQTSCVEVPRGGIMASPGPERTWGGNNAAGALESCTAGWAAGLKLWS